MEFLNKNTANNISIGVAMPSIKNILDEINIESYKGFFCLHIPYLLSKEQIICLEHLGFEVINGGYNMNDKYALIKWN